MRLLIGEHIGQLQAGAATQLRRAGYRVDVAKTGSEFRISARAVRYDLVILDANLCDGVRSGCEMVKELRREGLRMPILAVSSNGDVYQRVELLDGGADDCLVKPFNNREMLARVRAMLRRVPSFTRTILHGGNIEVDEVAGEVRCLGRPLELRLRERQLLAILLQRSGTIVPKQLLMRAYSGCCREVSFNAIEASVSRVRKKLHSVPSGVVIQTVRGIGYRLRSGALHAVSGAAGTLMLPL